MRRINGSLASSLDFEGPARSLSGGSDPRPRLRLAPSARLTGPDKYKVLAARRHRAQIEARRRLDLLDAQEIGR